jgi:glucose/arabinose dehydrogenase/predicted nucleic acid-binding Zn ribbon protein
MRTAKPLSCLLAIGLFLLTSLCFNESPTRAAVYQAPAVPIALQQVLTGLSQPLLVTNAHDGSRRLFIVERTGIVKVLPYGDTQPTVFLDISSKVLADRLGGFLGLAFHPQFAANGRFFVHYVRQTDAAVVTAEYRVSAADGNRADAGSEKILILQPKTKDGHAGGSIEFGTDGYLYVGLGDGSTGNDPDNNAQNIESLQGKILRLDVNNVSGSLNYSAPASNPFYGATPGRDEIFALGFRNPYRFSFDRATGQLYVADVGEKNIEEVDIVTAGGNYGWRIKEGNACSGLDPALCNSFTSIAPITQYEHNPQRCSITGGYVYRGLRSTFPQGAYIFGDLCSGEIFMFYNGLQSMILDTSNIFLVSFGEDEEGELYLVALSGNIYRMVIANADDPVVQLTTPNTTMKLKGNAVYNITWTVTGSGIYRNDIQWSKDGGQSWEDITSGLAGNVRNYEWTVPNVKSKAVKVRVISYGNNTTGQDESDENFVIKPRAQ